MIRFDPFPVWCTLRITIYRRALIGATFVWACWASAAASTVATGFDFDEVLMICTGLAALAYVVVDFKRERETQAYLVSLHEDLGRIKTMVGWDLPHSLSERVARLEAVQPEGLAERVAAVEQRVPEDAAARLAVLEDDTSYDRLLERVDVLEKKANAKPRKARAKKETTT